jgi:hypothetical protein
MSVMYAVHNEVLLPTLMYSRESWVWQKKYTSRVNAVEMRALKRYDLCKIE